MIVTSSAQLSDICESTLLIPVSRPLSCAKKYKQAPAHIGFWEFKSKRLSSSDFTSYSTAIAVKFLVSLQSGHFTGHQQVILSGDSLLPSCVTGLRVCS